MRPRLLLSSLLALGAIAALPASASAADPAVYCVNAVSCPSGGQPATLETALGNAAAVGGPAEIYVGPKPDGTPYLGPFDYDSSTPGNSVKVFGQSRPKLTMNKAASRVLTLRGLAATRVEGVDLVLPPTDNSSALLLDAATAEDVRVTGGGSPFASIGVVILNGGALKDSSVDVITGVGVRIGDGSTIVSDSTIRAPHGIIASDADLRLDRSRVAGEESAVEVGGTAGGNGSDIPNGLRIVGSALTARAPSGPVVNAFDAPVRLTRATIAGLAPSPAAGSYALRVEAWFRDLSAEIETSALGGAAHTFGRDVRNGHEIPLEVARSEWRADLEEGGGPTTRSAFVNASARFVDRVGGDVRLRGGDPLIDINPDDPIDVFNAIDVDQRQAIDGDGDGAARADGGAFEYRRSPPAISDLSAPSTGAVGAELAFAARGTDPDGDDVALRWSFGDGTEGSEGEAVRHAYASPGTYVGSVTAVDDAGVQVTREFTVTVGSVPTEGSVPTGGGSVPAVAPSGGDRTAPRILSARLRVKRAALRRGGRKARLVLRLSEAARIRVRVGRKIVTFLAPAGRSIRTVRLGNRRLRALARRRTAVKLVATDAAGNRSARKAVRLKVRR
ncbi:MAG TPA: PKD domain-containing protein [Solirubrobacteraceae bacterium]|jgi:hypothetical protein